MRERYSDKIQTGVIQENNVQFELIGQKDQLQTSEQFTGLRKVLVLPAIETFRWAGGLYLVILGMSLLLLPQGTLGKWLDQTWLRGAFMALAGFVLLWLTVLHLPKTLAIIISSLAAFPLVYIVVEYFAAGILSAAATLGLFTLGLLYSPFAPASNLQQSHRPDALGLILGLAQMMQGVEFLSRPIASVTLPPQLNLSPVTIGWFFTLTGAAVVAGQLIPSIDSAFRWAAHIIAGVSILSLWIVQSYFIAPAYWILGAAVVVRGIATIILPWWSNRATHFDSWAFRPRVALSLITAALVPVLFALPLVLNSLNQTAAEQLFARQVAFGISALLAVGAGIAGWWLAGYLSAPITHLMHGVNRIAEGERVVMLSREGTTEVVKLSSSVEKMAAALDNRMLEQQKMVEQLQTQNQALQELENNREDYLRALSHDLRNPLTAMLGFAERLNTRLQQQDLSKDAKTAEAILKAGKRLNSMIEELVVSLKLESGLLQLRRQPIQLPSFVLEIGKLLDQSESGERIKVAAGENLPAVPADPNYLERIFANLLSNALKYSPPSAPVSVTFEAKATEITIAVRDQGAGMSADEQTLLFNRYYRTEPATATQSGLGLGLYVTRSLVEAHGGRIWVESQVGKGSTFYFTLLLQPDAN